MKFLSDNLVVIVLLVLTLLTLVLLAVVVSAALRGGGAAGSTAAVKTLRLLGGESLRLSFRSAIKLIEANLATRSERYNLSWTLLLNESEGIELPLLQSGLQSALSADSSLKASAQGISWNFFDKGVVVQLRSNYLGSPDPDSATSSGIWDDFLGLCRSYRPQRPFDSIVLSIPCAALLDCDPQAQLALVARAKAIHRRLWLAQNRLALRFPIHLVVTECEQVPGFATFGAALPEPMRRSILGWVSPYELVAPFRGQWVDSAMDQIVGAVADSCAELCALEAADADSGAYFLLPGEVERLRAGLKVFCEELMRPSAYHESFLLRGMYLTGDGSAAAALRAGAAGLDAPPPVLSDALAVGHFLADVASAQGEAGLAPHVGMPVFLRDIFERKIFPEVGLVRSSARRLRRPAVGRLVWWSAVMVPTLWALGLAVATFRLDHLGGIMVSHLQLLNGTRPGATFAGATAGAAPLSQQRAATGLDSIELLGNVRFDSVFMPGSWPMFDPLHEQLQDRLERGFVSDAIGALREGAFAQLSQLTGVARDPLAGGLVDGGQCTLPAHWNEQIASQAAGVLNLQDLSEYVALIHYVDRLKLLDLALGAMQRLEGAGKMPPSGDDLALAVQILLKRKFRDTPIHTAALIRAVAHDAPPPPLPMASMQAAARCSLRMASTAMYQHLFDGNGLLLAENTLAASMTEVRDSARHDADLSIRSGPWQGLRAVLDNEQRLLVAGKGGWMQATTPRLGTPYDGMLERIRGNALLGQFAAQDSKDLAAQGFARFQTAWNQAMAASGQLDGAAAGLVWAGTGWAFTPERKALHDTVSALMAQPYMKAGAPLHLPDVPAGATIVWDKAQLAHAAGLAADRKAFQGGAYSTLPPALQRPASEMVDLALAASARTALAQAVSVAPAELPSADTDAERIIVRNIGAWLKDLGAHDIVNELDAALTRDALSRLGRLDEVLVAAQVYMPRDVAFQGWQGRKDAMFDAFGARDAAALDTYLTQQQDFIDTANKQAEGVLVQLSAGGSAGQPLVVRWRALAVDQQRYKLKSPTSTRKALEQFITGGADIDTGNCADKLPTRPPQKRAADLFSERLQTLQDGLLARCRALVASDDQRQWQLFAEAYNRDLGKRAPFAALPAGDALPAERNDIDAVMKLYDLAHAAGELARRAGQPASPAAVRQADLQLLRVRDLLAPLYPREDGQTGGFDVAVQFRANTAAEVQANQIIDWSLTIGTSTVRLADPARALRWEPGMPVLLSLRLARDGAAIPRMEAGRPGMSVAERTVSFRFDDPWALFTFIGNYRDVDTPGDDGRLPLLRFEFPVASADATAQPRARVFLRLSVSAPGKHTPLAWPAVFPAQAPLWQETQQGSL